ncbi:MAG: hypothetical protein K0Q95_3265 [Bacteroidota bacterium]|jgi:hypothetical protein|nr:hypothetical protein [Bacteroidota bacterium]
MMFLKRVHFYSLLLLFLLSVDAFAQKEKKQKRWKSVSSDTTSDDYYSDNTLRYENYVYRPQIKSIQLYNESFELSQPILSLGATERLKLSFDDLDADLKTYSYTIIHCNANWEPSDLVPAEYIDGFADNNINDYRYSFNTLQKFTHYTAYFPNNSLRLTKSGNYLVKVYVDGDPNSLVLSRRFMIYDNRIQIKTRVTQASIIEDRNYKQELDFTIDHSSYPIKNPYNDLHVVMTQNNRWDNQRTGFRPTFVKDNELVYDQDELNVFPGGNEFRYFDMKSIRFHSERIYSVKTDSAGNHVYLYTDEKRSYKRYSTYTEMNGNFYIHVQEGNNSDVEADYCFVTFFLPYDDPLVDGNLYVFGAFNDWRCNKENLMHYNKERIGYECTLYLKQGFYNYEYAFLKDGSTVADETLIEGSHYETENEYVIYVYHRQQGTFYDQLIGVKRVNSMKDY